MLKMKPVILLTSLAVLAFITLSDLQSSTDKKNIGTKQRVIEVCTKKPSGPEEPHEKTQVTSRISNPSFSGKTVNYFILIF